MRIVNFFLNFFLYFVLVVEKGCTNGIQVSRLNFLTRVCYPDLPCFEIHGFEHHGRLPRDPDDINVKLRLNTRVTGPEAENAQILNWRNPQTLRDSSFDPKKPTFMFVHGFNEHVDIEWLIEIMQVTSCPAQAFSKGSCHDSCKQSSDFGGNEVP